MSIAKLFPKKERTQKENLEREYKKKIKKLGNELFKHPTKVKEFIEKAEIIMDNAIKDGIMTKQEKEKQLTNFLTKMNKAQNILNKVRR